MMKEWACGFLVLVSCLSLWCCKTTSTTDGYYNQPKNSEIQYVIDTIVCSSYIDSICIADTIPTNYVENWQYLPQKDYITNKDASQWTWFKPYQGTVYTRQRVDKQWRFTKRVQIAK